MRNEKPDFNYASDIVATNYILAGVRKKLPEKILRNCLLNWSQQTKYYRNGYVIYIQYYGDGQINRSFELYFTADNFSVTTKVEDAVYTFGEGTVRTPHDYIDFRVAQTTDKEGKKSDYYKDGRKAHKLAVAYIVSTINSYFDSNPEKFFKSF